MGVYNGKGIRTAVWTAGLAPMGRLGLTEEAKVWAEVQAERGRWGLEFWVSFGIEDRVLEDGGVGGLPGAE